jgi:hypothetical protein
MAGRKKNQQLNYIPKKHSSLIEHQERTKKKHMSDPLRPLQQNVLICICVDL